MKKTESRDIIIGAVKRLAKKLNKYPYYFTNEEDIRCQLYSRIITHYRSILELRSKSGLIKTNSVHAEAMIEDPKKTKDGKKKKHKIDIMIHHTDGIIPVKMNEKSGKIYFYGTTKCCNSTGKTKIGRRTLIEVKINKSESRGHTRILPKIRSDLNKRKKLDFNKAYLIFIDRQDKLEKNPEVQEKIRKLTENNLKFVIIYIGCQDKGKKIIKLLFKKGKMEILN